MSGPSGRDARAPARIARWIETEGVAKVAQRLVPLVTVGVRAGVFIGFGGVLFTPVTAGAERTGPPHVLGNIAGGAGGVALAYRLACSSHRT